MRRNLFGKVLWNDSKSLMMSRMLTVFEMDWLCGRQLLFDWELSYTREPVTQMVGNFLSNLTIQYSFQRNSQYS